MSYFEHPLSYSERFGELFWELWWAILSCFWAILSTLHIASLGLDLTKQLWECKVGVKTLRRRPDVSTSYVSRQLRFNEFDVWVVMCKTEIQFSFSFSNWLYQWIRKPRRVRIYPTNFLDDPTYLAPYPTKPVWRAKRAQFFRAFDYIFINFLWQHRAALQESEHLARFSYSLDFIAFE
jgi:hypothetical protein